MATVGNTSRSGRVIKKSCKLIDSDDSPTIKVARIDPSLIQQGSIVAFGQDATTNGVIRVTKFITDGNTVSNPVLVSAVTSASTSVPVLVSSATQSTMLMPSTTPTSMNMGMATATPVSVSIPLVNNSSTTPSLVATNNAHQTISLSSIPSTSNHGPVAKMVILPRDGDKLQNKHIQYTTGTPQTFKIKTNLVHKVPGTLTNKPQTVILSNPHTNFVSGTKTFQIIAPSKTMTPNRPVNIVHQPIIGLSPTLVSHTTQGATYQSRNIINRPNMIMLSSPATPIAQAPRPPVPISTAPISTSIAVRKRINQERKNAPTTPTAKFITTPQKAPPATPESKKQHSVSAYVLWSCETRSDYQLRYPDLDFVNLSRKMGEIWNHLPNQERAIWFKKANHMNVTHSMSGAYSKSNADDLKPKCVSSKHMAPITSDIQDLHDDCFRTNSDRIGYYDNQKHVIGSERIDISSIFTILGDSLQTISSLMQRGVKYDSEIDYSLEAGLSTLLDSAVVAMGSLVSLSASLPMVAPKKAVVEKTLDEIVYLMPPDEFSNDV